MKTKHQVNLSAPVIHRGDQTLNNPIRRRWFALRLAGLLLISICALLPFPAHAQCKHWDISGQWLIRQSDGGQLQVNLTQEGPGFTGIGRAQPKGGKQAGRPALAADISGGITDNAFVMKVTLGNRILRYRGSVGPDGKIDGVCHSEEDPGTEVHWVGMQKMKCADEADKSSSSDTEDQPGKHKNKKKHHHHDDDQNRGND
jgi:hypothetical protein